MAPLNDVEREIGLKVPVELEANTLSGLFMARLSRMPEVGDEIVEGGFRLCVETTEHHRVGNVLIEREPSEIEDVDSAHPAST